MLWHLVYFMAEFRNPISCV